MKILLTLALLAAGAANAFDFDAATDGSYSCSSYCIGFTTDDPAYTVDYVNMGVAGVYAGSGFRITTKVNGVGYQGNTNDGFLYANDGTFVTLSNLSYTYRHTCTHSGRGQHCTSWYFVTGGTITP